MKIKYQRLICLSIGKKKRFPKKKIEVWKKSCYTKSLSSADPVKQELVIKHSHIMSSPFDSSTWQQVDWLKTQVEEV